MDRTKWERKRFDEVFDLQMGKTPDRKDYSYFGGDNVWVSIRDLTDKYIVESNEKITDKALDDTGIKVVKKGTVIMSFKLTVGKCGIAAKDLYTNEAIMAFNLREGYMLDSSFLYYYLQGYHWEGANKAVMGITLNKATISKQHIQLPSLSDQQAIVTELDKLNEVVALKRKQLADLDSLAQSLFYEMCGDPVVNEKGWEIKQLGELALVKTGPFGSMLHKDDYISNGVPLVNPVHMKNFQVVADKEFSISQEMAERLKDYSLKTNDVVFARRGDIGRCAVITEKENGYLCGTGSLFVRFGTDISPVFILFIIRSASFTRELISKAKGATMLNLNSTTISELRIPLPPLPLQQSFAAKVAKIEAEKQRVKASLKDLEMLLASRMQYWFDS